VTIPLGLMLEGWDVTDLTVQPVLYRRVLVALRATRGAIEVIANAQPGAHARAVDQRGRLRLPRGVLRAAGLGPGDRVVIARSGVRDRVLLVRADRVGIDVTAR